MGKVAGKKARPDERSGRPRREVGRGNAGSGEGALSALANLREIERARLACEPAEDVAASPALAPGHPAATTPPTS
jgi:hypothetical protein